jgi:adenosylhomocysteine nucleosidase
MIGIIGAMEEEVSLLKSEIELVEEKKIANFTFFYGTLEGKDVCILQSGIGKVNAAVGCTVLIQTFEPELIINSGAAGGISKDLQFGDLVIADTIMYHDVDITAFGYRAGQIPGMPEFFTISPPIAAIAHEAIEQLKAEHLLPLTLKAVHGLVASGDVFVCEQHHIAALAARFPEVLAVEMEGAAIAHTCFLWKVPVVIIRSLSDIAGYESPKAFNEFLPLASKHSAEIVCRLIALLA